MTMLYSEETVEGLRTEITSVRDALMECDWDVEPEPADCIRRMKKEIDALRASLIDDTWYPNAGTYVSLDGDPPLRVEEVHYNNGVAKLSDGSWAAFTHMTQVPDPNPPKPSHSRPWTDKLIEAVGYLVIGAAITFITHRIGWWQ